MTGAVIILMVTIFVGLLLYVYDLKWRRTHDISKEEGKSANSEDSGEDTAEGSCGHGSGSKGEEICCGRHLICEKSLSPMPGEEIVYFDDEELDRYAGREADCYTEEEAEEFREVLQTLLPQDIAPWARSIQLRGISLPLSVRDELFLLLEDVPEQPDSK